MRAEILHVIAPNDLAYLARHMRPEDVAEVWAATGSTPYSALADAVQNSAERRLALINGKPAAAFGVTAYEGGIGIPWLLGTDAVYAEATTLTREARRFIAEVRVMFPKLVNYVDARNVRAVRWLQFMGFTVHEPTPFGAMQLPFHRFEMGM